MKLSGAKEPGARDPSARELGAKELGAGDRLESKVVARKLLQIMTFSFRLRPNI